MTGQAVGKHLQLLLVVRLAMTLAAIRDLAVPLVAGDAGDLAVLAHGPSPLAVNIVVATAARLHIGRPWETDLQRGVNAIVAGHAVLKRLARKVPFMTFEAVRLVAVPVVVALLASLPGVRARELLQLLSRTSMAIGADIAETLHRRNP